MRNILISIKPKHCCNILNNSKTLEVRTTCPREWKDYLNGRTKIKPEPCKIDIYCTKGKDLWMHNKSTIVLGNTNLTSYYLNGKVVAEFTLNDVIKFECSSDDHNKLVENTKCCLTLQEIRDYCKGQDLYGWQIDNLIIYDKPKELSKFQKDLDCDDYPCNKGRFCEYAYYDYSERCKACSIDFDGSHCIYKQLKRPPQSWCYVEEKGEEV